jgi:hypothetical protein
MHRKEISWVWLLPYFLAIVMPRSIGGNPELFFAFAKIGLIGLGFFGLVITGKVHFQIDRLISLSIVIGMALIFSIPYIENISFLRILLYLLILLHFSSNYEKINGADKLFNGLILLTVIALIISIIFPDFFFFYYSWNSFDQSFFFLDNNKFVTLYGLHSSAAFVYGVFIFWLITGNKTTLIEWCLILIFFYLIILMMSASAIVATLFVSLILLRKIRYMNFMLLSMPLSIFLILNYDFELSQRYLNIILVSINNRITETGIGFNIGYLLFNPIGFYNDENAYWGDFGYLDHIRRFSFFALVFYYAYFKMVYKNLNFVKNCYFFIIFLFILEFGHTISKSRDFFPIIILLIFAMKAKYSKYEKF